MLDLVYFLIGAVFYRVRGGGFGAEEIRWTGKELSTTNRRLLWSLSVALLISTHDIAMGLVAIPLVFLGTLLGYFGAEFDLFKPENRNPKNYALLTARGIIIGLPLFVGLSAMMDAPTAWGGLLAGAMFVPCYRLWAVSDNKYGHIGEMILGGLITMGIMGTL